MFKFQFIPNDLNFNFLKIKYFAFIFSLLLICITLFSLFLNSLNFGIDFKGGILLELRSKSNEVVDLGQFRSMAKTLNAGEISVQRFGKDLMFF